MGGSQEKGYLQGTWWQCEGSAGGRGFALAVGKCLKTEGYYVGFVAMIRYPTKAT